MPRIRITFERRESGPPHGFELGDLTVTTPAGTVTSKGRTPDAGMMIYLALDDLMYGVSLLLRIRSSALSVHDDFELAQSQLATALAAFRR